MPSSRIARRPGSPWPCQADHARQQDPLKCRKADKAQPSRRTWVLGCRAVVFVRTKIHDAKLRWDRERLAKALDDQVRWGEHMAVELAVDSADFDNWPTTPHDWHDRNRNLLRLGFSNTKVRDGYDPRLWRIFPDPENLVHLSAAERLRVVRQEHDIRLRRLRQILDNLDLYEDPDPEVTTPSTMTMSATAAGRTFAEVITLTDGTAATATAPETVFVVHGRDNATKNEVARALHQLLGREPVILHEEPDGGRTIIEKFEHHANLAGAAVVILSPDDVGGLASATQQLRPRARQNVVYELGWFHARLGRGRVIALVVGAVEKPSDIDGVLYVPKDSAGAWKTTLARELRNAGLAADANKLRL